MQPCPPLHFSSAEDGRLFKLFGLTKETHTHPHSHTNDDRYLVSISYVLNIMLKYFYMNDLNPYNCFSQGRLGYAAVTNNPQISVIYNDKAYFSLFYISTVELGWEALFHMVLILGSETWHLWQMKRKF